MAIERRDQFYKVCRVAFELACSGLKPYNLNSGEVYIKNLGWLQSDDFRVRKIITSILGYTKGTPDTMFESLKEGIRAINGGRIFNQIENLNNSRMCVLLVGKEDDLIKGVASYISNLYSTDCLLERNYSGFPEKYIFKNLLQPNPEHPREYSLFDLYLKNTNVLFLRGLENLSSNTLKHIAREIDDTTNINGRRGVLIIGTDDITSLPEYFVRQFEIVNLEPKKQEIAKAETKSVTYNWSVSNNKNEIYSNEKPIATLSPIPFKLFNCLYRCRGRFVRIEKLEKCWDKKPEYNRFLVEKMSEVKTKLKNGLTKQRVDVQGEIIESKKNNKRKITAYKLSI